jgi:hypothetical protein
MTNSNNCSPNIQSKPSSGLNSKNSRVLASGKRLKISDEPSEVISVINEVSDMPDRSEVSTVNNKN